MHLRTPSIIAACSLVLFSCSESDDMPASGTEMDPVGSTAGGGTDNSGGAGTSDPSSAGNGGAPVGGAQGEGGQPTDPKTPIGNGGATPNPTGGGGAGGGSNPNGGGNSATGGDSATGGNGGAPATGPEPVRIDGVDEKFSFFVTSYHHIKELSGSEDGFGGDLRYNNAATGLEGADAICQEIGRRVGFGQKTWRAFLSTSTVNAITRIGEGPWYDFAGQLVAENTEGLTSGDRPAGGCCDTGTYDEMGVFHDGKTDVNNDNIEDDDHDTMTATLQDGTYAGFSCEDWTSTTAVPEGLGGGLGGLNAGIQMGHSWPARSGQGWTQAHAGHACAAGTNFIQDGPGDSATVGGGGGYGGFYCFALSQ